MNIMLISQCSKKALRDTRRVLDQFAERKGNRTWQTPITQQGVVTLRKMLRKNAKRNTAVACHWIKSANRTELLWIVGNIRRFNNQGTVPTNTTERDILRTKDENNWRTAEVISLLAGIAGLFHDFGKANALFQWKLEQCRALAEPYRHEWVSLRLFQAFVNGKSDNQWLARLANISAADETALLEQLEKIQDGPGKSSNPFQALPPLARVVGWLIVSHHRLPKHGALPDGAKRRSLSISTVDEWLTGYRFEAYWNSPQCDRDDWNEKDWKAVWQFDYGTPLRSQTWCQKAHSLAKRALKHTQLVEKDWLEDRFTSHIARLCVMLADHCYSAGDATTKWQDPEFGAYANTDRKTRRRKQKLDEHNIGVGQNALLLAKSLPKLRQTLPAITRHKAFKKRSENAEFRWQDKAYELSCSVRERAVTQGFFGINMASTGCGKTFANARIMYGLADEKVGCRFNVALGLRTLTLQTGDALQERLRLESDDMAVLIGSQAVRELHDMHRSAAVDAATNSTKVTPEQSGSESAASLLEDFQYVSYDGSLDDGRLSHWLKQSPKLHQLLSAPVLVSTIDHLIPATEGERGGKQIAPMLRLLTSDLVLDEPDDFGLGDTPALARLVNWAGMLGSRVLLSSATLPPALITALFDAYAAGRRVYNTACGEPGIDEGICCGWFDEFNAVHQVHAERQSFTDAHQTFVTARLSKLQQKPPLRRAELIQTECAEKNTDAAIQATATAFTEAIYKLHADHCQQVPDSSKRLSIGLVRMANINPMVAVAQAFLQQEPEPDTRIHFCIYHSQHPLLVRSQMEAGLDAALNRRTPEALWQVPAIRRVLEECTETNQIFVVFATAVAEVGRDHDYDWAVVEPSSIRSLIQLAGRIQRHRQEEPKSANLLVLNQNFKALKGSQPAYNRPGFESEDFPLRSHDLTSILLPEQYQIISAAPRIQPRYPLAPAENLADLEHAHLAAKLFGHPEIPEHASLWWRHNPTWCAELQRRTPFRRSTPEEEFVLYKEEEGEAAVFNRFSDSGELLPAEREFFKRIDQPLATRIEPWFSMDPDGLIEDMEEKRDMDVKEVCLKFGRLSLRSQRNTELPEVWQYHPQFGIYGVP